MYKDYTTNKKNYKEGNIEILKDVNKDGKDNNWKERKKSNLKLADSYKRLGFKKYYRVVDCSTFLEFVVTKSSSLKLLKANFCKVRLCPMCAWRRSLKIFGQVSKVMDKVEKNYNYKYIFLTLTVRNCYGEDLKDTLDLMTKSFNKLSERKAFKQAIKGYFRSLEVTYDKNEFITNEMYIKKIDYYSKVGLKIGDKNPNFNKYHPHFHLILAVNESYFKDTRIYLTQDDWTNFWKKSLKVDYTPVIDVRRVKSKNKDFGKVIAETAKYTVKADDYLIKDENGKIDEDLTDNVVETLDKALHRKRLVSFGFIFKEIHRQLKLDDPEEGRLENQNIEDELRDDLTDIILRYQWNIGIKNYKLVEVTEDDTQE